LSKPFFGDRETSKNFVKKTREVNPAHHPEGREEKKKRTCELAKYNAQLVEQEEGESTGEKKVSCLCYISLVHVEEEGRRRRRDVQTATRRAYFRVSTESKKKKGREEK